MFSHALPPLRASLVLPELSFLSCLRVSGSSCPSTSLTARHWKPRTSSVVTDAWTVVTRDRALHPRGRERMDGGLVGSATEA